MFYFLRNEGTLNVMEINPKSDSKDNHISVLEKSEGSHLFHARSDNIFYSIDKFLVITKYEMRKDIRKLVDTKIL